MRTHYEPSMTMREALARYFAVNQFGDDGGYNDAWVDFKIGPLPFPFPNTKSRVRALQYHDMHHILTDYDTDTRGEFEIAGWEIGAGCRNYVAAWVLNLGGLFAGLVSAPVRVFRAFVRGRRTQSLYGQDQAALLDATVAETRRLAGTDQPATPARLSDVALFALFALVGLVVGLLFVALTVPLLPVGFIMLALRQRRGKAKDSDGTRPSKAAADAASQV